MNVKKMNVNDLLVCYVRGAGIDYVARIIERPYEKPTPWPGSDYENETAYVANVKYFPITPTIQQEEFFNEDFLESSPLKFGKTNSRLNLVDLFNHFNIYNLSIIDRGKVLRNLSEETFPSDLLDP